MRRLLPRLLGRLKSRSITPQRIRPVRPPAKGAKSLRKPLPPHPVFFGRSRSILLDDVNPIMHPKAYRQHKGLPPQVRLPESQRTRTVSKDGTVEDDVRREMTVQEREWWANPYRGTFSSNAIDADTEMHSVLATPPICDLTPDFLIRISIKRLPSSLTSSKRRTYTIVPDGLQHPKFKGHDRHRGHYIVCRRDAIQEFDKRGSHRRILSEVKLPSSLPDYIGHLLRLRILQELELLAERLQARPQGAEESPLLRRLTWDEFSAVRAGKPLEDPDAVAVLVVPLLKRDPTTKMRPVPDTSPLPPKQLSTEVQPITRNGEPLSLSTMCYASLPKDYEGLPDFITPMKVPLYNGYALFPSKPQRAALHERLCKVLLVERRARWRQHGPVSTPKSGDSRPATRRPNEEPSPAFLLRSGAETILRADSVPLAIALWRLRMWEGDSWERGEGTWAAIV